MTDDQTLAAITAGCVTGLERVLAVEKPDIIIAQGDTTFIAALAAFYNRIPFAHVGAGLRT